MVKHKHMDLPIEGMHCASCVLSVNKTFGKVEGVEEVDADLSANKLHITVDTKKISYEEMERLVRNLGFELHTDEMTLRIQGMHCASCTMNVENFLIRLDGIFDVKADLTSQSAKIRYDSSKVTLDEIEEFNDFNVQRMGSVDGHCTLFQSINRFKHIFNGIVITNCQYRTVSLCIFTNFKSRNQWINA